LVEAGHEVIYLEDKGALAAKLQEVDGVFVRILDITPEMLKNAPNLKIISKHGVGLDNIALDAAKECGVVVTSTPNANSLAVAEFAFTLMMTLAKNVVPVVDAYKNSGLGIESRNKVSLGTELTGKTLGILGLGRIGSMVAKMAMGGFGMKVMLYDPYVKNPPEGIQQVDNVEEIYKAADFITLHLPLVPETKHMLNARAFELMKPTAILINCARGPIVDEAALIEALRSGKIGGAGLDVTDPEPAEPDNPLFTMSNVIVTPHYAPFTKETAEGVSKMGCENLIAFFAGKEMVGRIV